MDNIQKNISSMNIEIYDMTMDLQDYETQLWEHFANMETSVNDIQQQGQYLLSALGV
jgi:flagellar capping protein FliD